MTADEYIRELRMEPHVEGGYCRELFQSCQKFDERPLASSIYYLLKSGQVSKFHRLKSDELWFYHAGSPLLVHQINAAGELTTDRLGLSSSRGEYPQVLIPATVIFGAEVAETDSFCLLSCVVTPGFDYRDYELFNQKYLLALFPQHKEVFERFYKCSVRF